MITRTTPSCGGMLLAQFFWPLKTLLAHQKHTFSKSFFSVINCHIESTCQKCFNGQHCDIWSLGHYLPILIEPTNSPKTNIFTNYIFCSFFFCNFEPTFQKLCFYDQNCDIWSLGPFLPIFKGPKIHQKLTFSKTIFFPIFFCHIEPLAKVYVSMTKIVTFDPWGTLGPVCQF